MAHLAECTRIQVQLHVPHPQGGNLGSGEADLWVSLFPDLSHPPTALNFFLPSPTKGGKRLLGVVLDCVPGMNLVIIKILDNNFEV